MKTKKTEEIIEAKEEKKLEKFTFPDFGTIEAENLEEATKIYISKK